MSVWDWIDEFDTRARAAGDAQRARLPRVLPEAFDLRHTDPDRMLALFAEGRRLAAALRESWWVLFFDYWRVETLVYYKDDYRGLLDLAVKLTLELHRPANAQHPIRYPAYANLIAAYLCLDPHGYADEVRQALRLADGDLPDEDGVRYLFLFRREWFAWELGELDEVRAACRELQAVADADRNGHRALHHQVGLQTCLARLAYRTGDWAGLGEASRTAEELARRRGARYEQGLALLWQAVWARHDGAEEEARRLFRLGAAQMARLGKPPDDTYFDSVCAFHELAGDLGSALEARQRQKSVVEGAANWRRPA
jgi:hypothetical protein